MNIEDRDGGNIINQPSSKRPIVATDSRIAYENPWIRVREDQTLRLDGATGIYGVVEVNDSVVVVALNDKNEMYIAYGYCYPLDTWSWQIPGGGGDQESPEDAAKRELIEETGISATNFYNLGSLIVSCGVMNERMAIVVATNLHIGDRPHSTDDADSIREGKFISFEEASDMIDIGEICDSQSIAAIYMAEKWVQKHAN